jgi:predicted lipid-binding transport protein (Tim44 family)
MDTIIYAVVAIIVFSRLWATFGRRNEEDGDRPNPFIKPPDATSNESEKILKDIKSQIGTADKTGDLPPMLRPLRAAPDSLAGGLEQIKTLDPSFDEKQFLQGARAAFSMVIEGFFKGDLTGCEKILSAAVRAHFQNAIELRRSAGQTVDHKLERLKDVETSAARVEVKRAFITVRYVSEQMNALSDSTGTVISGEKGKLEEITDLWTFARDTSSSDPNWLLVETHS